jgi:hypothetical protein
MRVSVAVVVLTMAVSAPAPAPAHAEVRKVCGALAALPGKIASIHVVGRVTAMVPQKEPTWVTVTVADPRGDQTFELSITPPQFPFKVGDTIDASVRRAGGRQRLHDALIKDGAGKVLLIISGSGAVDWADGWKVTAGKVVESAQNPNTKQQSVRRTHALDLARGKTQRSVPPEECTVIEDGGERYAVYGAGHSWLGQRPPGGVDYQQFVMIRK